MAYEQLVAEIDQEMAALQGRLSGLETARNALNALNGSTPAPAPRAQAPAKETTTPRTTTSRGPKGQRSTQALKLVREHPGITIPDMAQRMRIEPNYLYRVMPKLVEQGKVERREHGWYAADTPADTTPAAA